MGGGRVHGGDQSEGQEEMYGRITFVPDEWVPKCLLLMDLGGTINYTLEH